MKTALIVSEFNPFHLGHAYLLDQARAAGAELVACVMSGNWVQRGDAAFYDKFLRAEAAVKCGADIVIELPLPWAMSTAETFARGAVKLGTKAFVPDMLVFGSECGDVDLIERVSQALDNGGFSQALRSELSKGVTFAAARQSALESVAGIETSSVLSGPNDTLAVEYLRALPDGVTPVCVKRVGSHDSSDRSAGFSSASFIRREISGGHPFNGLVPDVLLPLYTSDHALVSRLDAAVLSVIRRLSPEEFALAPDISEGLENRIAMAAVDALSVSELIDSVKTKRYTHARIRRIILSLFLGVDKYDAQGEPPYVRVLACGKKGRALLSVVPSELPLIIRARDEAALSGKARDIFDLELKSDSVHALTFSPPHTARRRFCNIAD